VAGGWWRNNRIDALALLTLVVLFVLQVNTEPFVLYKLGKLTAEWLVAQQPFQCPGSPDNRGVS
jgi:hypothetical protein